MQDNIQKIIAVLNDFSMIDEVLSKTFSFAETYDTSVEILYVQESPLFDIPDFFRSDTKESVIDIEGIKASIVEKVNTFHTQKKTAVFVQIDDTENRVWAHAREDKETLIITAYHKEITQKLLSKVTQPVLILKKNTKAYSKIALVIDGASNTRACIDTVKRDFAQSDIELFYDYHYIIDTGIGADLQNTLIIEEAQRDAFEALKVESGLKGTFFIDGDFQDTPMNEYVQKNAFDMLYVCSQEDDFFMSDNSAIMLLDTLACDMLVSNR